MQHLIHLFLSCRKAENKTYVRKFNSAVHAVCKWWSGCAERNALLHPSHYVTPFSLCYALLIMLRPSHYVTPFSLCYALLINCIIFLAVPLS